MERKGGYRSVVMDEVQSLGYYRVDSLQSNMTRRTTLFVEL